MKKRKVGKKTTARKTATKKTAVKKPVVKRKRIKISEQLAGIQHSIDSIRYAMDAIKQSQQTITKSVDAVMKDYIRHPLKIDGMSQPAFRALVDAAARNNPGRFRDDFNGELEVLGG